MVDVKTFLKELYSCFPLENKSDSTFYQFAQSIFDKFLLSLNELNDLDLKYVLQNGKFPDFEGNFSKIRFINLMKHITDDFLSLLSLCYHGDFLSSSSLLNQMFCKSRYRLYLTDIYLNYIDFSFEDYQDLCFYRMRDEYRYDKDNKPIIVDNCWHVPFNLRRYAYTGRFSQLGYPCLYLGDSMKTCEEELGPLDKDIRWCSSFKPKMKFSLYDLRVPSSKTIEKFSLYEQFSSLITYPLLVLCSVNSRYKGFNEEYYIPQLLFNYLFNNLKDMNSHIGIIYSSVKNPGGYNIVMPAFYKGKLPPKNGYSDFLMQIFEQKGPFKCKEH